MKENKLGKNIWFNLLLFGFMGQIAWAVENMYFNTFLFNSVGGNTNDISKMVACSAAAAVITTFIMGTLSDKLNRRKVFVCVGYIAWGITVAVFALISRENISEFFHISEPAKILAVTVSVVIIMDCIMTFMGSTSNDAAFNAWITDVTSVHNRGVAESSLALMPVFATIIVTVAFGAGVTAVGYPICFIALGALVVVCGIIGIFSLKDSRNGIKKDSNYFKDIVYGFRPKVIKENKALYLSLLSICVFCCAVQVFMPYIFIYVQHFLGLDFGNIGALLTTKTIIIAALSVVAFVVAVVLLGKAIDRFGKTKFIFPSVIMFTAGLILIFFARKGGLFALSALLMLLGYGLLNIILNASVRDFTPEDKAGLFQGVRMIFVVLIPMVIGPKIGSIVTEAFAKNYSNATYINDYKEIVSVPVPEIFLASAIVGILIIIPLLLVRKKLK